jgi:peptide deformylase
MYGDPITVEGTELLARCLQHETDHLNGILFIDRMNKLERKQAMKEIRNSEWFGTIQEIGLPAKIKVSPHSTYGLGL